MNIPDAEPPLNILKLKKKAVLKGVNGMKTLSKRILSFRKNPKKITGYIASKYN